MNLLMLPARRSRFRVAWVVLLMALAPSVPAQWLTQSISLTNGWNAMYLHVDASHTTLDSMVGSDVTNPILAVWRWNPSTSIQFVDDPLSPLDTGSQWVSWNRDDPASALRRLNGNSAYLVQVGANVATFTWNIQGKVVAQVNEWSTTGLNLIGFPTVPTGAPSFETFLSQSPELQQEAEIYRYVGGELTNNPARVLAVRNVSARRGQAFWVRAGTVFNHYFGPFKLEMQGISGVEFRDNASSISFLLKNLTPAALTVAVELLASETPPPGETAIAGVPPLLIRGSLDMSSFSYSYTNLPPGSARSWTLAPSGQPGSVVEVVLGLNRSAITGSPGSLLAGILRFTDSLGYTQLDAPVSATVNSTAGLWVGRALVNQVGQYLKSYAFDSEGQPVASAGGQYIVTSTNTSLAPVTRPYPLRLIVHNPAVGNAALLQRVFVGFDAGTNFVAANSESVLDRGRLAQARRITATHLPWSKANSPWMFNGRWGSAANLTAIIELNYDDHASNPFLHTYHPDHDNRDAAFQQVLPPGSESYTVQREITLSVHPAGNDFSSLISGTTTLKGDYLETITLLGLPRAGGTHDTRQFQVRGAFTLNRISEIPALTIVP